MHQKLMFRNPKLQETAKFRNMSILGVGDEVVETFGGLADEARGVDYENDPAPQRGAVA